MKKKAEIRTDQVEVRYNSTVTVPIEGKFRRYVRDKPKHLYEIARKLTFCRARRKRKDAILILEKRNPIFSYEISFYSDRIVSRGFSSRLEALRDFEELTKAEISTMLNRLDNEIGGNSLNLYIC